MAEPVFVFLGAPGSGKGTQSSWLSSQLGIPRFSTGEILRVEARRNSPAAFELRRTLASGSLVSDEMACAAIGARLRAEVSGRGVILDGFPRTLRQAIFLDELLASLCMAPPSVIHLEVSPAGLLARLTSRRQCASCGAVYNLLSRPSRRGSRCERDGGALVERDDDRESIILRRLEDFNAECQPLVGHYRGRDFTVVDGDRDRDAVAAELLEIATHSRAALHA